MLRSLPEKLRLRSYHRADARTLLAESFSAAELREWSGNYFRFPLDDRQLRAHRKANRGPNGSRLFIAQEPDGQSVGYGEIARVTVNRSAFLARILVLRNERGKGHGARLVDALLREAFDIIGLHRIELNVYEKNAAARACYLAAGFKEEGVLRDAVRTERGYWNEVRMSILEHEYRARPSV